VVEYARQKTAMCRSKNILTEEHTQMIQKTMTIEEILRTDAGLADILLSSGMHCLGCIMASGENLEQACAVHGIDADKLTKQLNDYLANK
jgi:hybrid cluster-associated redox disulfide protein